MQEVDQDPHGRIRVRRGDRFGRVMADAALASHEQHGDRAKRDHRQPIVPGAARKSERRDPGAADRCFKLLDQSGVTSGGRLVISALHIKTDPALSGDSLESLFKPADRVRAHSVARAADVER